MEDSSDNEIYVVEEGYVGYGLDRLSDVEAIRHRPAMYLGSTGEQGVLTLIDGLLKAALLDSVRGTCQFCEITLHRDDSITVWHDGEFSAEANQNVMEAVTTLVSHRPRKRSA